MKLEVEVISKEIIKPSSPTPDHLRHYRLSFLDQITPSVYNSIVLFYPNESDTRSTNSDKLNLLKQSLSKVLTHFYPLAGCMKDNLFVDCNDKGVPFLQAQVINCLLSEFLEDPVPGELNKLVPFELHSDEEFLSGIQFNIFECGGIGIGVCISHKIVDALSFFTFIKRWAATAHGDREFPVPEFILSTLFPPKVMDKPSFRAEATVQTKRFVFRAPALMKMREKYADQNLNRLPTRVEALSAFIWSHLVATGNLVELDSNKTHLMALAMNLRPRMDPPLTENIFGNCCWIAATIPGSKNEEDSHPSIVSCLRDALNEIDTDFVKKLQEGGIDSGGLFPRKTGFGFTSLCRFPIYEADFGWNRPVWVGPPARSFNNSVAFFDTKGGDGIEAYLSLKEDYMTKLENDKEFLKFVCGL